jgi:hypothetical protein
MQIYSRRQLAFYKVFEEFTKQTYPQYMIGAIISDCPGIDDVYNFIIESLRLTTQVLISEIISAAY